MKRGVVRQNYLGFTLVEIMVAMGIAGVVSLGLVQVINMNTQSNKSISGSLSWVQMSMQIDLVLNNQSTCAEIFKPFYQPPGPTNASTFPDNTPISIPRPNSNTFVAGYIERSAMGGAIVFDKVEVLGANNRLGPTVTELTIHIHAKKILVENPTLGQETNPLQWTDYDLNRIVRIVRNPADNSIRSCSPGTPMQTSKDSCEAIGGEWRDPAPGLEPNCRAIQQAQNPNPPSVAAPFLTGGYQNLCPAGQAISGIDLTTGTARALCTNSNPKSSSIDNCAGGVISWVSDSTIPSGGKFTCISLPGAVPGGNVPNDGRVALNVCASDQHLVWDPVTSSLRCTNDFRQPDARSSCTSKQVPVWNGSTFTCQNQLSPATSLGPSTPCQSTVDNTDPANPKPVMKFLQWGNPDGTGSRYFCSDSNPNRPPACGANQLLTWNGSTFQCSYLDRVVPSPSGGATAANTCAANASLYYNNTTGKFECKTVLMNAAPPDCKGIGQSLQYKKSDGYHCVYNDVIDYSSCTIVASTNAKNVQDNWAGDMSCPNDRVAVGFCASGGDRDCAVGMNHSHYMDPDVWNLAAIKCCRLNNLEISPTAILRSNTPAGVVNSGLVSVLGNTADMRNDKNNYGNLAVCPKGQVVNKVCTSLGTKACLSGSGTMYTTTINCSTPNNYQIAPLTGDTNNTDSNNYYAKFRNLPTPMGCHIVSGRGSGEWADCDYNEVLVGVCSSGSASDCSWGMRPTEAYNQAMCCPVK